MSEIATPLVRPLQKRGWVRALATTACVVVIAAVVVPYAYVAWWRTRHPAPLGRSAPAIDSAVAKALPAGTPHDSAVAFLLHQGIDFTTDSGGGSRRITAMTRDVDTDGIVTSGVRIRLAFDSTWRLTSRSTEALHTGP